jgi:5-methylcytosine-specific restriction endonuclease McrA
MDYPPTRSKAKATGAAYYYTGKPCVRGHIALRKTKGCCVECAKEDWQIDNAKRALKSKSEAAKEAGRRYYDRNKEQVKARANARPIEDRRRYRNNHKENNPDLYKALNGFRKRRHRNATPKWLTYQQKQDIKALYRVAIEMTKTTRERYVVDHIIPLISDVVCGLHVPWNLRVITQEENLRKSNQLPSGQKGP